MRLPMQFSLRALGTLLLLVCLVSAFWGWRSRKQQSVANSLVALNGRVTYESPPAMVPQFIVDRIGHDYFCRIDTVTLYPTADADADQQIETLKQLPGLRRLAIWPGCAGLKVAPTDAPGGLSDKGVEFLLANLVELEHLSLLAARITEMGEEKLLARTTIKSLQYDTHFDFRHRSGGRQ